MERFNKLHQLPWEFSPRKTLIPIGMDVLEGLFRQQAESDTSGDLPVLLDFKAGIKDNLMTLATHYTVYEDKQELKIGGTIVRSNNILEDHVGIQVEPPELRQAVVEAYENNSSTIHFIDSTIEAALNNGTQVRCVGFEKDKLVVKFSQKNL